MNTAKSSPAPAKQTPPASAKKSAPAPSASRQADKEARKGDPLPAKNPQERSPKQENL